MNLNCLAFFICIQFVDMEYYIMDGSSRHNNISIMGDLGTCLRITFIKNFIAGIKPGCKYEMANI